MKRLVFCFDGTWNRLVAECPTNVVFTAESVLPLARDNIAQVIYYDEGVGTSRWERIRGGILGSGLVKNLADAYRFAIFNYTPGDEIYVFGFSRGAYTARSFAGLLACCSIPLRKHAARADEAIALYRSREDSDAFRSRSTEFRLQCSPHLCVSPDDANAGSLPLVSVTYLGVWDTVGALGIPATFRFWSAVPSKKYQFHNTSLSPFVLSARHAVAIDERRFDFKPTLWDNLAQLNEAKGFANDADDAPYQQKWFPGTHSSVGGGGERRGLSDQALDWVFDGARAMGLQLDADEHSRIYELAPDYREFIENSEKQSLSYRAMKISSVDRVPGPSGLHEVSKSAMRRWHELPQNLRDQVLYRPGTLEQVRTALDAIDPANLGVRLVAQPLGKYQTYLVQRGDTLGEIAKRQYGNANLWERIFKANMDKIENPHRIYPGQLLRIPLE